MATKIILISANRHKDPYPVYPIGIAYLKGYLLSNLSDCIIDVLDMNLLSEDDLNCYIIENQPDFVCVSLRNVDGANSLDRGSFLSNYKNIVVTIRKATSVPLIIGGAGFSIFPEVFMSELNADYGIKGEGERILCELLDALRGGREINDIPQLFSKNHRNDKPHNYIVSHSITYEPQLIQYYWRQSGMLNIQTKRGCPYECIYCTYPKIDGKCVRTKDVDSIISTIAKIKRDFGVNYWFFTDSVFNINNHFNIELAEALIRSDLNISWGAYFSPSNLSDDQMSLYRASGLTHIEFGSESFCDHTLYTYGKRFTFDDVLYSSELALKHNVFYSHFLILGGWGETNEHLMKTIENSRNLRHTVIFPYIGMRIYPNTILHKKAIEEGVVDINDDLIVPQYYITKDFNLEQTRHFAMETGKAWVFPDRSQDEVVQTLKLKRNKKGPLWEYLRKP